MSRLFGSQVQGPSREQQRAQRRQEQAVSRQTTEAEQERGARQRIRRSNRQGSTLFGQTGAAGIRETLG